jgi:hypothetical protein
MKLTEDPRIADPYARLRVPKYAKTIQICFFAALLALYYAVLIQRHPHSITVTEIFLYIWIAAFAYDEFGEFQDAGVMFYQTDFWSLWDLGIIFTGIAFLIVRKCTCPHLVQYLHSVDVCEAVQDGNNS